MPSPAMAAMGVMVEMVVVQAKVGGDLHWCQFSVLCSSAL